MAAIDQFLMDHPELKGKDPQRIADFVYQTQGFAEAGKDRGRFNEFFLGNGQPATPVQAPEPERGMLGKAYDYVKDAVQGDAAFPDVPGAKLGSVQEAAASAMGSDEDWAKAIHEQNPGSHRAEDKNGNEMILHADGRMEYVNKPGLDTRDVGRFGMKAAAFTPAGKATTAVAAAGKGLLLRAGTAAATAGATDAVMQKVAGRDDIDVGQVATTAAFGAGAEGASHAASGALRWAKKKYGNAWNKQSFKRRGQILARKMEIDNLTGAQYERLGKLDDLAMTDDAKMADVMFDLKQTRGQAMPVDTKAQRAARTAQLNKEEALSQTAGGQSIKDHMDQNYEALAEAPGKLADRFSGGARIGSTRNESAEIVQRELVDAKNQMESAFKAMYKSAEGHQVNYMDSAVQRIPTFVRKTMEAKDDVFLSASPAGTPKTLEALDHIESYIAQVTKNSDPNSKNAFTVGLKHMEQLRKDLNTMMRQTSKLDGGSDRRALSMVQKELMGVVERMGEASLFKGDIAGIRKQKQANKLFADYASKFRDPSKAGKIMQNIVEEGAEPDQVARMLFSLNGTGNKEAVQAVRAYKRIVGRESAGFAALKETFFYSITQGRTAEAKGPKAMVDSVKKVLYGDGQSTVKELYNKSEIANMKQFVRSIEIVMDLRKSSGTAERGMRMWDTIAGKMVPGPLTFVFQAIKNVASEPYRAAKAASISRIPQKVDKLPLMPSTLPVVGAATNQ